MVVYFGHSKDFDFINEFYAPIEQNINLQKETLIFPHKSDRNSKRDRQFYSNLDCFIAEVSYRATGLGIELGWASDDGIPIYCFYKKGTKPNSSLGCVTNHIIEYSSKEELASRVEKIILELKQSKVNQKTKSFK